MVFHWSPSDTKSFKVSSGAQDSHQYSDRSQHSTLDDLNSYSDFQLFQPPFQAFGDRSKGINYNWVTVTLIFHSFLPSLGRFKYSSHFSLSLIFTVCPQNSHVKWSNPGEKVAPSPPPGCSRYWKERLRVVLDYGQPTYLSRIKLFTNYYHY